MRKYCCIMGVWSTPEPGAAGSLDVGLVVTPPYCPRLDCGSHEKTVRHNAEASAADQAAAATTTRLRPCCLAAYSASSASCRNSPRVEDWVGCIVATPMLQAKRMESPRWETIAPETLRSRRSAIAAAAVAS